MNAETIQQAIFIWSAVMIFFLAIYLACRSTATAQVDEEAEAERRIAQRIAERQSRRDAAQLRSDRKHQDTLNSLTWGSK